MFKILRSATTSFSKPCKYDEKINRFHTRTDIEILDYLGKMLYYIIQFSDISLQLNNSATAHLSWLIIFTDQAILN